jgi:sugar lactone lactonase YvrE
MRRLAHIVVLMALAATAGAHPGWGIVEDRAGNVFFTDLHQVWKVSRDGRMSVAVPNVHTHELCIDTAENLLGEHLWYEGSGTKRWRQRVWKLSPSGQLSDVVRERAAFEEGDSFVRDGAGSMYWASLARPLLIRKSTAAGNVTTHATGDFTEIGRMTVTKDGVLYLMDAGDLRRVAADGKVTTLVERVSSLKPPPPNVRQPHYQQGLWLDGEGNVYIAVSEEKLVMRVGPGGAAEVVRSTGPSWSPSGGLVDRSRALWILEYDHANRVRLVRYDVSGREQVFDPEAPHGGKQP